VLFECASQAFWEKFVQQTSLTHLRALVCTVIWHTCILKKLFKVMPLQLQRCNALKRHSVSNSNVIFTNKCYWCKTMRVLWSFWITTEDHHWKREANGSGEINLLWNIVTESFAIDNNLFCINAKQVFFSNWDLVFGLCSNSVHGLPLLPVLT
jgi:hypothetical protein